ncbi:MULTISPECIES: hypothetical protein [unclassified Serratia (in: enterobacteria)]|uniref:phage tail fiber protein n=1 Tax=unclassified Serratia (in: enterobacteria) TaxID=2647522 RepID=UPI0006891F9B|nr:MULTISPECIES: hypothetical protein [unclassified Serratia (in: enterobacteria)]
MAIIKPGTEFVGVGLEDAVRKSATLDQVIAGTVIFKSNVYSYGEVMIQAAAGKPNTLLRFRDESGADKGGIYAQTDTGQLNLRWNGSANAAQFKPDGTVVFPSTVYSGTTALIKAGEYGLGGSALHQANALQNIYKMYRLTAASINVPTATTYGAISIPIDGNAIPTVTYLFVDQKGRLRTGLSDASTGTGLISYSIWGDYNTTVDANGFIKKASPVVKLFGDGSSELNEQSQNVTTERISEGVYRVSGVMGFNSDPAWGGPNGGIGLPKDNNDLALLWVDYEVDETGDLLIKTFHRINSTAPKFAQNIVAGYKEGQPIDIPTGRWIDLRVEMPASDEPEPAPETESAPETTQQPEVALEPQDSVINTNKEEE